MGVGKVSDGRGAGRLKHACQEREAERITDERWELLDFTDVLSAVLAGGKFFSCSALLCVAV